MLREALSRDSPAAPGGHPPPPPRPRPGRGVAFHLAMRAEKYARPGLGVGDAASRRDRASLRQHAQPQERRAREHLDAQPDRADGSGPSLRRAHAPPQSGASPSVALATLTLGRRRTTVSSPSWTCARSRASTRRIGPPALDHRKIQGSYDAATTVSGCEDLQHRAFRRFLVPYPIYHARVRYPHALVRGPGRLQPAARLAGS